MTRDDCSSSSSSSSDTKPSKQEVAKAELHVLVANQLSWKPEAWKPIDRGSATSVGFIKVHPETSLAGIRPCIKKQIRGDSIPEQFVFLKQVGRGSTICTPQQERSLKAKDFVKPHGEICILSSVNMVFSSRDQNKIPAISITAPSSARSNSRRRTRATPHGVERPVSRGIHVAPTNNTAPIDRVERVKSPSFRSLQSLEGSSYSMFQDNELMMAEIAFLEAKRALAEAHANALRNQYLRNQSVMGDTDSEEERRKKEEEEVRQGEERKRKQEELRRIKEEELLRLKREEELRKKKEEELHRKREEEQRKREAEARERERIRKEEEAERERKLAIEEEKRRKKLEREERERKIEEQLAAEEEKQRALRDLKRKAAEKRRQEEEERIAELERRAREEEEERRRLRDEEEERARLAEEMYKKEQAKLEERDPKKYTKDELEEVAMLRAKIVTYRNQRKELENKHHDLLQRLTDMEMNWTEEDSTELESKWRPKCKEEEVKTPQLYERNRQLRLELQMLYRQADTVITHAQAMKQNDDRKGMAFPSIKNNLRINLQRMENEVNSLKKKVATANIKYEAEKANREGVEKEVKQLRQELISSKISSSASKL